MTRLPKPRPAPILSAALSALVAFVAVAAPALSEAQAAAIAGVTPEKPSPGSAFIVTIDVSNVPATEVEAYEPALAGPVRYVGADVRPAPSDPESSVVELRFEAEGEGRAELRAVKVGIRGQPVQLGSLVVDIASAVSAVAARSGSWGIPARAWQGAPFVAAIVGPDGAPASSPPFAIEGAIVEPLQGRPGRYRILGIKAGTLALPALSADDSGGPFVVRQASIEIRRLPEEASKALAIGGPWRLALSEPRAAEAQRGDLVRWELRLVGPSGASPPSSAPSLRIEGPEGPVGAFGGGPGRPARTARGETEVVAGGVFEAEATGDYRLIPEPYPWFDAESGTVIWARADGMTIRVTSPSKPVPAVPESIAALASMGAAAGRAGRLSSAAAAFVAGSRGLALAQARRLEEGAFPPVGAREAAADMALALGNRPAPGRVLPPYGIPALAAAALAVSAVTAFLARSRLRSSSVKRPMRRLVGVLGAIAAACALLAAAGAYERAAPRFVSLGGQAKVAPSELSSTAYELTEGAEGRIAESAGAWTLVEPFGSGPAWVRTDDLAEY